MQDDARACGASELPQRQGPRFSDFYSEDNVSDASEVDVEQWLNEMSDGAPENTADKTRGKFGSMATLMRMQAENTQSGAGLGSDLLSVEPENGADTSQSAPSVTSQELADEWDLPPRNKLPDF